MYTFHERTHARTQFVHSKIAVFLLLTFTLPFDSYFDGSSIDRVGDGGGDGDGDGDGGGGSLCAITIFFIRFM